MEYSEQSSIRDLQAADCEELLIEIAETRSEVVETRKAVKTRIFEFVNMTSYLHSVSLDKFVAYPISPFHFYTT